MRAIGIAVLHLVLGAAGAIGLLTYFDSQGMDRPFDMFLGTVLPMGLFVVTGTLHGYWSGRRQAATGK